jgi:serine protease
MPRRPILACLTVAAALASLCAPAAAGAQDYVPGEVVVQYEADVGTATKDAVQDATGTGAAPAASSPAPQAEVLQVADGESVRETIRELQAQPGVAYAVPNVIARAAGFIPNDPGRLGRFGGWQALQWNFLAPVGINAPDAWSNLIAAGRPGGRGVTVAVLDTGVAYENYRRFRRSPDFIASQFVRGFDFVDRDRRPNDENGHGTFVAGVIGERVNNRVALTGIAYGAKIMPVRVLDEQGLGDAAGIAAGIRYAARNGAKVINLSLEFDSSVPASQIPEVLSAIRYANRRGTLVVAASGNEALRVVAYPARADGVLSVGATTEHLCQADYSNDGRGLDLMAPGGGADSAVEDDPVHCRPSARPGRDIYQLTFVGSARRFGTPGGYEGTSMASPHVAAVAALVIASGVVGARPSPQDVENRLKATARDLGPPGPDTRYGAGLIDAGRATARF